MQGESIGGQLARLTFQGSAIDEPVDELEFYYPISPRAALTIELDSSNAGNTESADLFAEVVPEFNRAMLSSIHEQAFASRGDTLLALTG